MEDYVIVGGGIGGTLTSLYLSQNNYKSILVEKEPYLGGCSSTFKRGKYFYNAGATTFAGYSQGTAFYDCINPYNIEFKKKLIPSTSTVIINSKRIVRYQDMTKFLDSLNSVFPNKRHKEFYELVYEINQKFYKVNNYYYSSKDLFSKLNSLLSFKDIGFEFYKFLFKSGYDFLNEFYGEIDSKYLDYIDNQVLIVAQAKTKEINALTMILSLGYQFLNNYYIYGGMGSVFESIATKVENIKYKTFIESIDYDGECFSVKSKKMELKSKNLVLNSTIYDSIQLFSNKKIIQYLKKYEYLYEDISAYVLYLKLDSKKNYEHHYQIICEKVFENTISNSIFISFGDNEDEKMRGSVTISIHTKASLWNEDEKVKRQTLKKEILSVLEENLNINDSEIIECFDASPFTFKKFINRKSLGGNAITMKNIFYKLPSNNCPIDGLYFIGDTTFAAQGWMGVSMGVRNLKRLIDEK